MIRVNEIEINETINERQQNINTYSFNDIVILGVGGIGSWVALDLALSGKVDTLHIVDPDIIEMNNLNRTPFRICDVGNPKVDAMKYLILERRIVNVVTYRRKTNKAFAEEIRNNILRVSNEDSTKINDGIAIIDCRDDAIDDFFDFPCKYYKIGYDGCDATLDGNPRNTAVWGRANGYQFTPSFICPAQLAANLVVTDILVDRLSVEDKKDLPKYDSTTNKEPYDIRGRINKAFTFNCRDVVETLYRESLKE